MKPSTLTFRPFYKKDWKEISKIYEQGIETKNATFRIEVPKWSEWNKNHLSSPRIVAELHDEIVGWAALSPTSNRYVYRGVAEVSIYISNKHHGKKIGIQLLQKLITESEKNGIWMLQANVFPKNNASLKIHKNAGFRIVGYREKIGEKNGIWGDIILLERRSNTVGMK